MISSYRVEYRSESGLWHGGDRDNHSLSKGGES